MQTAKQILRRVFPILFWIGVWELAAWRIGNVLLFPNPRIVLSTLWKLMQNKDDVSMDTKAYKSVPNTQA
jgi:ABC-type nitrate/sulfonate/bicarbonate transport system permease component